MFIGVLAPLGAVVAEAVVRDGRLTGATLVEAFESPGIGSSLVNSAILMVLATVFAAALGTVLALAATKLDVRAKSILQSVPLVPLTIAPLVGTIGWVFLLDPRSGWINVALTAVSGGHVPPLDVYSLTGVVIITTLYSTPFIFIGMSSALDRTNLDVFEVYLMNGSGRVGAFIRLGFGVLRPAMVAACILAALETMVQFAVPFLLNVNVLNVQIFEFSARNFPLRTDLAAGLAVVILVVGGGLSLIEHVFIRRGEFTTVGGKPASRDSWSLGKSVDRIAVGITYAYLLLAVVLPMGAIILVSFLHFWKPHFGWSDFTFGNYVQQFESPNFLAALGVSLRLAISGSLIVVAVGLAVVLVLRSRMRGTGRALYVIGNLPLGIPALVLGLGFLIVYTDGPVRLYGTITGLLLAYVVHFLPYGLRNLVPAASQIRGELSEAARTSGASGLRTLMDIIAPLLAPAIGSSLTLAFIMMLRELPMSALLAGPTTQVVSVLLSDTYQNGTFPGVAVMALFLAAVSAAAVVVQQLLRRQVHLSGGRRGRRLRRRVLANDLLRNTRVRSPVHSAESPI
jgi:iron(III) transport system permease protein